MAGFRVVIGAETGIISKSLAELRKDLASFKKQVATSTDPQAIIKFNQAIAQTDKQIKGLTGAQNINAIGKSIKEVAPGFGAAGFAVGNFSRVVQDAPFALLSGNLIAVSNNIDPLVQSFVQLKQQTGSTGAAMKALGSNLLGSGGLLLGFSLVNAALTFFSAKTSQAKGEMEGLAKAQADSNKEAGEEIAHLKVLAAVAGNSSNALKDRKDATQQLQKALKENNVELSQEKILNNDVAAAISTATQAILARARAKAIENRLTELEAGNLNRETKREEVLKKLSAAQAQFNKELAAEQKALQNTGETARGNVELETHILGLKQVLGELGAETKKATTEIDSLLTKVTKPPNTGGGDPVTDLLKQRIDALKKLQSEAGLSRDQLILLTQLEIKLIERDSVKLGFTKQEIQQRIQAAIEKAFPGESITSRFKIHAIGEIDFTEVKQAATPTQGINVTGALGLDKIDVSKLSSVVKALQDAAAAKNELLKTDKVEEFANGLTEILSPAFTSLFSNIQTEGGAALEQFGRDVARLIQRLLAAAAAAGTLAALFTVITGGNLAAFRGAFKGLFAGFSGLKFADGGIVTRATPGIIGEAGPEAVIPLSRLGQMFNPVVSGGGQSGEMKARLVGAGQDLIVFLSQANRSFNRKY